MLLEKVFGNAIAHLSLVQPQVIFGLLMGGAVIYWFTGASTQAVVTGAYRAVVFIKKNLNLDQHTASLADSKKVVEICTVYAQKGMVNIFIVVFSFALNAKKIVEVDLKQKGTPLHAATVVGDTVGDPFKDTSSVAMNPIIKFTTLFGLLATEIAVEMTQNFQERLKHDPSAMNWSPWIGCVCFVVALVFVYRSFYCMRIPEDKAVGS